MSGDTFDFLQGARETITGTLHDPAATTGDVLTVQADKSIAAQPGGGGAGGVQVVTVEVSSAEILALHDVDVILVPGVPGSVISPTGATAIYVPGVTPYVDHGGSIRVRLAGGAGPPAWGIAPGANFWDQAVSETSVNGFGELGLSNLVPTVDWDGIDLALTADSNPTDGDGTLLVTVSYFLAPTV